MTRWRPRNRCDHLHEKVSRNRRITRWHPRNRWEIIKDIENQVSDASKGCRQSGHWNFAASTGFDTIHFHPNWKRYFSNDFQYFLTGPGSAGKDHNMTSLTQAEEASWSETWESDLQILNPSIKSKFTRNNKFNFIWDQCVNLYFWNKLLNLQ